MIQGPDQLPRSLLPRLTHGPGPAPIGGWKEEDRLAFTEIAKNLRSQGELNHGSFNSIPDMWARPLLVDDVLWNRQHPLHKEIKKQWRGMLSAIALAVTRSFDLSVSRVNLRNSGSNSNDRAFLTSLMNLIPDPDGERTFYRLSREQKPWEKLYVFVWRNSGQAVGMISPTSLVCPAEHGDWTGLPWYQDNRLQSPLDSGDYLSSDDKNQLYLWLGELRRELVAEGTDTAGKIGELIASFQRDIGEPNPGSEGLRSHEGDPFRSSIDIDLGRVRSFNTLIARRLTGPENSSLKLETTSAEGVIIFLPSTDPDRLRRKLEEQWPDREPSEITVCNMTLNSYSTERQLLRDLRNTELLKEEELFLPDVFLVERDLLSSSGVLLPTDEITQTIERQFSDREETSFVPLLPVQSRMFEYFSAEELNQMIRFEQRRYDVITVSIKLRLGNSGQRYTAYKEYPIQEANVLTSLPLLEVFPNFRVEGEESQEWQEYYVLYYSDKDEEDEKVFQVDMSENQVTGTNTAPSDGVPGRSKIFRLNQFPSLIRCTVGGDQELGIIPLRGPTKINKDPNKSWIVGVDFGTSFTNVFYRQKDISQGSQKLALSPLIFPVTDVFERLQRSTVLYESFMSCGEEKLPLPTVLTVKGADGQEEPVLHGRVYMLLRSGSQQPNLETLRSNLKWRANNFYTELFLRHLALLISAEAAYKRVSQIEWAISYPTSFSSEDKNTYLGNWRSIIRSLDRRNGIRHQWKQIDDSVGECFRTEASLMAQYLADVENNDLMYTTCIDVGGGSSDISIWDNNHLVHQCSVRLAGQALFSELLLNQSRRDSGFILDLLDLGEGYRELVSENKLSVLDNLLISEVNEDWLSDNVAKKIANLDNLRNVIQLSTLGIAGLYYYMGTILRGLGLGNPRYRTHDVFIGGHGSRIFHWLSKSGNFNDQDPPYSLFSEMLSEGLRHPVKARTRVSRRPKSEVAHALTLSLDEEKTRLKGLDNDEDGYVFTGEKCCVDGTDLLETDHLDLHLHGRVESFEVEKLSNLKQFFDLYHSTLRDLRPRGDNTFDIDSLSYQDKIRHEQEFWSDVKRAVDTGCRKMIEKRNADEVRVQPPFVIGLEALLKVLSR